MIVCLITETDISVYRLLRQKNLELIRLIGLYLFKEDNQAIQEYQERTELVVSQDTQEAEFQATQEYQEKEQADIQVLAEL